MPFFPPVYVDQSLIVIDKPHGMHAQPDAARHGDSAVDRLQREFGLQVRVVHRLDFDASGLLVFARTRHAAAVLSVALESHAVERTYRAVVKPPLPDGASGTISAPLRWASGRCWVDSNGAASTTHWRVVGAHAEGTELEVTLETGRMHQIRVHLKHAIGPIVGDTKYGGAPSTRLWLRAIRLAFEHPLTRKPLVFMVPPWQTT